MKCEKCGKFLFDVKARKFDDWINELFLCRHCSAWLYQYIYLNLLEHVNINDYSDNDTLSVHSAETDKSDE
jgi:hypothetical protein